MFSMYILKTRDTKIANAIINELLLNRPNRNNIDIIIVQRPLQNYQI